MASEGVKRGRSDGKATVQSGACSRGGLTRGDHRARDHARGCEEQEVPWGIVEEARGALDLPCGRSEKTSDGIVDPIAAQWHKRDEHEKAETRLSQIQMDNGPERRGSRPPFVSRLVPLVDAMHQPVQRLDDPPSHRQDHPMERCWGL